MDCPACGSYNPTGKRFCGHCGAPLTLICPACGSESPPGQRFCGDCGRALAPASSDPSTPLAQPAPAEPAAFGDGRYQVKKFLGEGGKKRVYLCHDTKLDRDVAFALIKTEGLDEEGHARIQREAQAMGRLGDHPHIVPVHDLGEEVGQPYLVSQLMPGGDVEGLIDQAESHRLPLEQVLAIVDQVCQALEHAHFHGIVHRDLKPGNVWLTANGTAKLGDFGLAVALDRSRLTQAGMMVGTVAYMPPEQAMGAEVTPRSDLYSLGCMLYEMVTGRPPFVGEESVAIITQHLNTPPVAPSWHNPDCPPSLEALILRLLEKDPSKRPSSAAEVRQALQIIDPSPQPSPQRGEGADASPTPGPRPPTPADNPIYRRIFVGRESEVRQAQAAFDRSCSGQGSLLTVVGEPGIGKTALCEQLATYAAVRGGTTLVGHCYEEGSVSLPYMAFVEAMRGYVLTRDPEALKEELGSGAAEVARIVSEVRQRMALEPSPSPGVDVGAIGLDEDRWRLYQAVVSFLRNASTVQPLLIVLEDLHWADRGTLDLLIHLARNLQSARLLVVGTYRDVEVDRAHPLSAALAELRRSSSYDRVLLRGLSADEVQRMLAAITGQEVRWGFAEAVQRQTEGNPLFVQEVVRYLAEEGLIAHEGGRWQPTGNAPLEMSIPEGLRDVIGRRLSRLTPVCNRLLSVAAVIGRDFDLATLRAIASIDEEPLVEALEQARRVGVLEEQARPGVIRYRFAHAFFRQTLYEEMGAPRRLRLHQEVARALEAQHAARLEDHAAELAEHFAQSTDAADLRKAVQYGQLAATRAMAVYAYGEAVRLLEQALEAQEVLDPDDRATRCDLLLALGEALMPAGEAKRVAEEVATQALALAEALGDDLRTDRACQVGLEAIRRYGSGTMRATPIHRQWSERADRHAQPGSSGRVTADLALAASCAAGGRWAEGRAFGVRALALARQLDDPEALFNAASRLVGGFSDARHQEEQLRLADEFTARTHHGVSASTLERLFNQSAGVYLQAGKRERAEQMRRDMEQLAARTRDPLATLQLMVLEVSEAVVDGNLEGAVAEGAHIVGRGEELGMSVRARQIADEVTFRPLLHLGRAPEALAATSETLQIAGVEDLPMETQIGLWLAHLGRMDEARVELHERINRLGLPSNRDEMPAVLLAHLLETSVILEDQEAAALLAKRLEGVVAAHLGPTADNVARHLGAAAALLGHRAKARVEYERSLEWATSIRFRPEIALTRLGIAELLLAGSPDERADALAHLDFAIDEFRAMKMQPSLERALRHKGLLRA